MKKFILLILIFSVLLISCSKNKTVDLWFSVDLESTSKISSIIEKHQPPNGLQQNGSDLIMLDLKVKVKNSANEAAKSVSIYVNHSTNLTILHSNSNQTSNGTTVKKNGSFELTESIVIIKEELSKLTDSIIEISWEENDIAQSISIKYPEN